MPSPTNEQALEHAIEQQFIGAPEEISWRRY